MPNNLNMNWKIVLIYFLQNWSTEAYLSELKKRDEDMQEFLDSFEASKESAEEKQRTLENNIVQLLERISRVSLQGYSTFDNNSKNMTSFFRGEGDETIVFCCTALTSFLQPSFVLS